VLVDFAINYSMRLVPTGGLWKKLNKHQLLPISARVWFTHPHVAALELKVLIKFSFVYDWERKQLPLPAYTGKLS
jgi:hypothetical protein